MLLNTKNKCQLTNKLTFIPIYIYHRHSLVPLTRSDSCCFRVVAPGSI
jgi:hypothetical protein